MDLLACDTLGGYIYIGIGVGGMLFTRTRWSFLYTPSGFTKKIFSVPGGGMGRKVGGCLWVGGLRSTRGKKIDKKSGVWYKGFIKRLTEGVKYG